MAAKGSGFEREICKELSLWWSKGKRDDVFWRTSGSGARAKVRGKKGKRTDGQHGDIAATLPNGKPFIDLILLELKRGYSKDSIQTLLDRDPRHLPQAWEGWIQQTMESLSMSESKYWMIISKRDGRKKLVTMENRFYLKLGSRNIFRKKPKFSLTLSVPIRDNTKKEQAIQIVVFCLEDWYSCVDLKKLKRFAKGKGK